MADADPETVRQVQHLQAENLFQRGVASDLCCQFNAARNVLVGLVGAAEADRRITAETQKVRARRCDSETPS
jgi:hypothetical protein